MTQDGLTQVTVVNASGVSTTVRRKPTKPSSKPKTMKALIAEAAVNLGISKAMSKRLGQKSEELPSDSQAAMLDLMNQNDQHGTVKNMLVEKFGKRYAALWPEGTDPYKNPVMEEFAVWVIHASHHLHAIESLCREIDSSEYSHPHVNTNLVLAGLHVHASHGYTVEQYRDIALLTLASSINRMRCQNINYDLTVLEFMSPKHHEYLSSGVVRDYITSDHEKAVEALRLIIKERVLTEAELMHRLEGIPRGLISGVI